MIDRKGINVNFQHNLVEIIPDKNEAVFALLSEDHKGEFKTFNVSTSFAACILTWD